MQKNHWCFTFNNYDGLLDWEFEDKKQQIRYAIYCEEVGDENGTPHFQGYVEFKRSMRITTLARMFPGLHWYARRGTREQARDYCLKTGKYADKLHTQISGPYEYGTWTGGQGYRTDIHDLKKTIEEGKSEKDIWDLHPDMYLRYYRAIQHVKAITVKKRDFLTELILVIGPTGTGKSAYVHEQEQSIFRKTRGQWWDTYQNEEAVVLEEFYGWLPFDTLLRLADRYPELVEIKGGFLQFTSKRIYITCNKHPDTWYSHEKIIPHLPALYRRFTKIILFRENEMTVTFENFKSFNDYYYSHGFE